jgi:hypothetical protein
MDVVNKYQATLLSNQLSTLVELNKHAEAMSLLAERVANKSITFKESTEGTLYRLGNWTTDDRIITTVKRELDGSWTHQEVEVSKNFANIDVETSVSRSAEPFQITDKTILTNFQTKEYIEFSKSLKELGGYMNATARLIATNIFNYSATYDEPIFDGQVIPTIPQFFGGVYDGKAIHTPIMTFGDNTIGFNMHFFHPTFAGYTLEDDKRGVIEYKRTLNNEVQDLATYDIQLGTENTIDDSGVNKYYPLVDEETGVIDIGTIYSNLDPNCLLGHTHNISIVTDAPDEIILNGNFGFYNNLIRELNNPSLEVYVSTNIYDTFSTSDKKVRPSDVVYSSGVVSYNSTTRELSVTHPNTVDNIAIVLDDDIILAFNGIDECYINFMDSRTDLIIIEFGRWRGSASANFTFTATANGLITQVFYDGTANGDIGFTGTSNGGYTSRTFNGTANGNIGFTGVANGSYEGITLYSGSAEGNILINGTANGEITEQTYEGTANGSFNVIGTSSGGYTERAYEGEADGNIDVSGLASGNFTSIYQAWSYIGTSAPPEDSTVDLGSSGTATCRTSSAILSSLESAYPAENYATGYIIEVEHSYDDPVFGEGPCTPYYYRSVEITE